MSWDSDADFELQASSVFPRINKKKLRSEARLITYARRPGSFRSSWGGGRYDSPGKDDLGRGPEGQAVGVGPRGGTGEAGGPAGSGRWDNGAPSVAKERAA